MFRRRDNPICLTYLDFFANMKVKKLQEWQLTLQMGSEQPWRAFRATRWNL